MKTNVTAAGLVLLSVCLSLGAGPTPVDKAINQLDAWRKEDRERERRQSEQKAIGNYTDMVNRMGGGDPNLNRWKMEEKRRENVAKKAVPREWRMGKEKFEAKFVEYKVEGGRIPGPVVTEPSGKFVKTWENVPVTKKVCLERGGSLVWYPYNKLSDSDKTWLAREIKGKNKKVSVTASKPQQFLSPENQLPLAELCYHLGPYQWLPIGGDESAWCPPEEAIASLDLRNFEAAATADGTPGIGLFITFRPLDSGYELLCQGRLEDFKLDQKHRDE